MMAVELVTDRNTKESFPPGDPFLDAVIKFTRQEGLIIRNLGSNLIVSPPLVFTRRHADDMIAMLARAFEAAAPEFSRRPAG